LPSVGKFEAKKKKKGAISLESSRSTESTDRNSSVRRLLDAQDVEHGGGLGQVASSMRKAIVSATGVQIRGGGGVATAK